jgi:Copper amine oxidase N-terminal domain
MYSALVRTRKAFIVSMFVAGAMCVVQGGAIAATVTLDGQPVTPVYQRAGHLLIPFRAPMEAIGATVDWNSPTATASLNGAQLVTVNMGSTSALIKGTTRPLSVAPELIGGNAYVPVEALADICGAQVTYAADQNSAIVTGCTLANINTIATPTPSFNLWPWLIGLLAVLGGLWLWARNRATKTVYTTNPYSDRAPPASTTVVRGTVDDYVTRLKAALSQMDGAHRASFVQQLAQTFKENRSTIPDALVTSTKSAFDASAAGAPGPVSSLVDQLVDRPQILQITVKKFAALYPGELGTLLDSAARL